MSCTSPLKAWQIGINESGKPNYKVTNYKVDHIELTNNGWNNIYESFVSPFSKKVNREFVEIPCGKCESCRLANAKQWTNRCLLELKNHESSYFITLTYDDSHINRVQSYTDDGLIFETGTLSKRDFQLFMKSLRKEYAKVYDNKLRYFMCGEYGSHTLRPHYHIILFGLKLIDLELYKKSSIGNNLYTSKWLNNIWKKGYVVIGEVTEQSISYTCRYVLKKTLGKDKDYFIEKNLDPEFTLSSRKPGLARQFYEDNKKKIFSQNEIYLSNKNGSIKIRPCRYYEKLYEIDFPDDYARRKLQKKEDAITSKELVLEHTSLDYLSQLDVKANILSANLKKLPRKEL